MNTSTTQQSSQEVVEQSEDEEDSQPREEDQDCLELEIDCEGEEYYDKCFPEELM